MCVCVFFFSSPNSDLHEKSKFELNPKLQCSQACMLKSRDPYMWIAGGDVERSRNLPTSRTRLGTGSESYLWKGKIRRLCRML